MPDLDDAMVHFEAESSGSDSEGNAVDVSDRRYRDEGNHVHEGSNTEACYEITGKGNETLPYIPPIANARSFRTATPSRDSVEGAARPFALQCTLKGVTVPAPFAHTHQHI